MRFHCGVCGQEHDELPDIGADYPDHWFLVPEAERERRVEYCTDACAVDGEAFYIRGVIRIPIHDYPEPFGWGVWVSQKKENFAAYMAAFDSAEIGPSFGWLSTSIAFYLPDATTHLKTKVHFQGNGRRPLIELEPSDHPLAVHQRDGVSLTTAWDFVHFAMLPREERQSRIDARRPAKNAKPTGRKRK